MSIEAVRDYYGKVLQTSADLKTDACCTSAGMPDYLKQALSKVHDEVLAKFYGCGLVLPEAVEGTRVLDLGCGSGRDVYALAQLVGASGDVVGVDMTDEQLSVAEKHVEWHRDRFGYASANTHFLKGYIEKLPELDLKPASFDLVVSNCVVNLSPDKSAVLRGAHDLLKPGGEIYFADVYADRRLDEEIKQDPVLLGECLGGALYWNDFLQIARQSGFMDPRLVSARLLEVHDPSIIDKIGAARFVSATYRLFKIDAVEEGCENYGQTAIYLGGIANHDDVFHLDAHRAFPRGQVVPVSGNTHKILAASRLRQHFELIGNCRRHYGLFPGGGAKDPFKMAYGEATIAAVEPAKSTCC